LLTNYADAGNEDRLYDRQPEFLERVNHDVELAGAALLASDVRRLCNPGTLQKLRELLAMPELVERLAEQIRLVRWFLRSEMHPRILLVLHSFIEEFIQWAEQKYVLDFKNLRRGWRREGDSNPR
jgi:predicted nucleotidyltransferase